MDVRGCGNSTTTSAWSGTWAVPGIALVAADAESVGGFWNSVEQRVHVVFPLGCTGLWSRRGLLDCHVL
jgi:hypothetical protein